MAFSHWPRWPHCLRLNARRHKRAVKLVQFSSVSTVSFFTSSKPLSVAGEDALLAIGRSLPRPMGYQLKGVTLSVMSLLWDRSAHATMDNSFYSFDGQMAAENAFTPTALLGYVFFKDIPDLNSAQGLCQSLLQK